MNAFIPGRGDGSLYFVLLIITENNELKARQAQQRANIYKKKRIKTQNVLLAKGNPSQKGTQVTKSVQTITKKGKQLQDPRLKQQRKLKKNKKEQARRLRKIKNAEKKKAALIQSLLRRKARLEMKLARAQGKTTIKNSNKITPTQGPKPKTIKIGKTILPLSKPATPPKSKSFFVTFLQNILATWEKSTT